MTVKAVIYVAPDQYVSVNLATVAEAFERITRIPIEFTQLKQHRRVGKHPIIVIDGGLLTS